ncbi:chlorhexidine efflux transporter [Aeromonas veronii]|uniref:chlorhexidine efflux transporter n=1 Tax=Aeromonas veronii TaxID=654 RepID=UPI003B676C22
MKPRNEGQQGKTTEETTRPHHGRHDEAATGISMLEALVLDLGFVVFYLIYAFVYNWGYDKVFPIPREVPHGMPQEAR